MCIIIDDIALARLKENQPNLKFENNSIKWTLNISMFYDSKEKVGHFWNIDKFQHLKECIFDTFSIHIDLTQKLPIVKETWQKIKSFLKNEKYIYDLHISTDGVCCLMPTTQLLFHLKRDNSLESFFEKVVYPFFYSQSYHHKYGERPMGEFSHNWLWYIEFFNKSNSEVKKEILQETLSLLPKHLLEKLVSRDFSINREESCFCWSLKKIKQCHHEKTEFFLDVKKFLNYCSSHLKWKKYNIIELYKSKE